jgi:hypothetical protein
VQPVPNALPDTDPFIGAATLATWDPAASVNVCSRAARRGTSSCGCKQSRILHAPLAIPCAAGRHVVQASAEDVAELFAAVAVHELRRLAKLVTHHACIVAAIVFEDRLVFDYHGQVQLGDLLLVFDRV